MKKIFLLITAYFISHSILLAQAIGDNVHTVLFLGNSITYAGTYISDVETAFVLAHPGKKINFINVGLPSETVSGLSEEGHAGGRFPRPDLHERLHRILAAIKPDIIFACYGMNDGIYLPFDEGRFQKYKNGINWLHDTLMQTGARVIMLTPPVYDEIRGGAKGYATVLDKYSDWLLSLQKTKHWEMADIHYPMKKYMEAHQKLDAQFAMDGFALANDGVHPGEAGHWLMAKQILLHLEETSVAKFSSIKLLADNYKNGAAIAKLIAERQSFMKDAWLTFTRHTRPEMKTGLPMEEANAKATAIQQQIDSLK